MQHERDASPFRRAPRVGLSRDADDSQIASTIDEDNYTTAPTLIFGASSSELLDLHERHTPTNSGTARSPIVASDTWLPLFGISVP